ncbi:MAG: IclR family transcriptional regulator [Actinomycetes bacterium]
MDNGSGVGVIDKSTLVLNALAAGPHSLAELVEATGLPRPTAHRLATALEFHLLVGRDADGRFTLGPRILELAGTIKEDRLLTAADPVLASLCEHTGESAQLYQRVGDQRVCVAASERSSGLRDTVPVGSLLSMHAGSAAQVLLAWEEPSALRNDLRDARFGASALARVRGRGWAESVGERESGVASVSAPVLDPNGQVIAAISVSGPIERLSRNPGQRHAQRVMVAASSLSDALRGKRRGSD